MLQCCDPSDLLSRGEWGRVLGTANAAAPVGCGRVTSITTVLFEGLSVLSQFYHFLSAALTTLNDSNPARKPSDPPLPPRTVRALPGY